MTLQEENNERYAEYYFDYRIVKAEGKNDIKTPKIYIERDFFMPDLNYTVFTVPEEWIGQSSIDKIKTIRNDNTKTQTILNELPYDTVKIVFDIKGIWCDDLSNEQSEIYKNAEIKDTITFTSFYSQRCRIVIDNNTKDHSGTGMIDMYKNNVLVARFYFAINFTFRKKIFYSINVANRKLEAKFRCKDRPQNIAVDFFYKERSVPCLKKDESVNSSLNSVGGFNLNFGNNTIINMNPPLDLKPEQAKKDNVFGVKFRNPELEKYYILECENNNTIKLGSILTNIVPTYTCPYCHKIIDREIVKDPRYLSGGIPCHIPSGSKFKNYPKILDKSGNPIKNSIYCYEDLKDDGNGNAAFKGEFLRILPPHYLDHESFKIAFSGATRSGKTTFISRFFDLSGTTEDTVSMPMTPLVNSTKKLGISLKTPAIPLLKRDEKNCRITDLDWTNKKDNGQNNYYVDRKISLIPERYPLATTTDTDFTKYPFIAEVNNKTYISFYDIAGEDAQHTRMIQNLTGGKDSKEITGIFYLINGNINQEANEEVVNMLINSFNKNCPVAVILTKMDLLENKYASNAHCLRTDYITDEKKYDGSVIEREINYSSEEIKAYLTEEGLLPNFVGDFNNVKYFGVSAFNFFESFHDITDSSDKPGHIKFECSSKRMELPFIWMLRQFNVIE